MGCISSRALFACRGGRADVKKRVSERPVLLLSKYTLGPVVGQGAFGVVYQCHLVSHPEHAFAVKMVDKVETPLTEIKREAAMMQRLWEEKNPCTVRLHEVFYEPIFVCMVMDLCKGGDMIKGMQRYWKERGQFSMKRVQQLCEAMFRSIAWLHSKSIIHRDVKGDNYLMSTLDLGDPDCMIYLSDFGTVRELQPGRRLRSQCGTKSYWSPEVYDKDYGLKADVWAGGVMTYGLVTSRFPFKDENDVRSKALKVHPRATKACSSFITSTLQRSEASRLTAEDAHSHEFVNFSEGIVTERSSSELELGSDCSVSQKVSLGEKIPAEVVDAAVVDRRRILVERVERAHDAIRLGTKFSGLRWFADIKSLTFDVEQKRGESTMSYAWWGGIAHAPVLRELRACRAAVQHQKSDALSMRSMLLNHGINVDAFGKGGTKTFNDLMTEIETGEAQLMLDATMHKTMVRVVRVVHVRIVEGSGRFLIHAETVLDQRGKRREIKRNQLPCDEIAPHENGVQAAWRVLYEKLNLLDCDIAMSPGRAEIYEEDEESRAYPGVRTVFKKQILEATIQILNPLARKRIGLAGKEPTSWHIKDQDHHTQVFQWLTEEACKARHIRLRASTDYSVVSPLVPVPAAYDEKELQQYLDENHVSISSFGQGGNLSYEEFIGEFAKGEAFLSRRNRKILRIVHIVILKIHNWENGGAVLFESHMTSNGTKKHLGRLPALKQRPNEHVLLAARRYLQGDMHVDENLIEFEPDIIEVGERNMETFSSSFCGLPTVYRKLLLTAHLSSDKTYVSV